MPSKHPKEHRITQEQLREVLHYDPDTGAFTWKKCIGARGPVGAEAGTFKTEGYRVITIRGDVHRAHRLAFLYMTGAFPDHQVDHINGDRADNRWANLREATQSQNNGNLHTRARSSTGVRGVVERNGRYLASIGVEGKTKVIGRFRSIEEAASAYRAEAKKLFGEFANFSATPITSKAE